MKFRLFLSFVALFLSVISAAQVIKGRITDPAGRPVEYATVYISELRQGTSSNAKGDYEIRLPEGKYLITYQSLGYQPVYFNVTITHETIIRDVILPMQYYQLPEVRVSATGEDPAYGIMRKAIGMAPYYLNHVSSYKADIYLKGNVLIKNFPRILQKSLRAELKKRGTDPRKINSNMIKEGDSYMMESVNEVEFTAPDKYVQKVKSIQSSIPDLGYEISPLDYIEASFYEPMLANMAISPLSPQAFNHYKFRYLGATSQGDFMINKIEVIPKRKSQQLFTGTIYIIEDLWCLHSVDVTNENLAGKIRIQQLFVQFHDDLWMPVSHKIDMEISIMGFRANAFYGSSVKYLDVKANNDLDKRKMGAFIYAKEKEVTDTALSKTQKQIGKILQKEELTNRDMSRLSKLMDKESKESLPDSVKKELEIKDKRTTVIEENAVKRDTSYWSEIRPIPLSEIELRSLSVRDSIEAGMPAVPEPSDTLEQVKPRKKNRFITNARYVAFGHTWRDSLDLIRFTHGGLIGLKNINFNTVDGFIYGTDMRISKMFQYGHSISFYPDIRWTFSREKLMWKVNANYTFGKARPQALTVRAGNTSRDISNGGSINLLLNTLTTLAFKKNYLKLYESEYYSISYKREIVNGLSAEITGYTDNRKTLQNTTTFSFNKKAERGYTPNIPDNEYVTLSGNPFNQVNDQKHYEYGVNITWIPFQRYRLVNDWKIPMGSDWPTFVLSWEHGKNSFPWLNDEFRHYDLVRFEASRTRTSGALTEFRWRVRTGGFIDNRNVPYIDFFHFNSQPLSLFFDNYVDAFMLPPYYSLSTPEYFGEVHAKYTTPYLLIKLLPFLSNSIMRENVSLSYLGTLNRKNYTELGYSLSEFFFIGEIGVYAGFDDLKFRSAGFKLALRFN